MTTTIATMEKLNRFAERHGIALLTEVNTGLRACVGFAKTSTDKAFIAHNPMNMTTFDTIAGFKDDRLHAPGGANSYDELPSLVVLVTEDTDKAEALSQLAEWVDHLESQGELEVVEYSTGANPIQAMLSGSRGWAIRYTDPA